MANRFVTQMVADAQAVGGIRKAAEQVGITPDRLKEIMCGKSEPTQEETNKVYELIGKKAPKLPEVNEIPEADKKEAVKRPTSAKVKTNAQKKEADIVNTPVRKPAQQSAPATEIKTVTPPIHVAEAPVKTPTSAEQQQNEKKEPDLVSAKNAGTIRRLLGLKKTHSLAQNELDVTLAQARDALLEKKSREVDEEIQLVRSLFDEISVKTKRTPDLPPSINELVKAASEASDEGIGLAIKILKKWKKENRH